MNVVAVVGAREPAGVVGAVGVPAVDELGGAQRAGDGGELVDDVGAAAGALPRQISPSTAPMSNARLAAWLDTVPSTV